ncbi:probable heat shock protein [Fulvimarina pelagi HTCC2506]|uniref:Protein GrpE n=2 Tax=Fulvimarina pelagi TaxID=217511 RepID=Q0G309_9HYPH|nr:probable heat shock protein [Fulvimarina pelagi HTCC2506]BAT30997.1 heat shock protein GrpE [Fulvimarina pelagi]
MTSDTGRSEFANLEGENDETLAFDDAEGTLEGEETAERYEARIIELESENADVKDRLIRLAADMENLRRRTERDVKDARNYAVTNFAREMLSVADNLRRALDAVPEEARAGGESGLTALIEGVEMTERGLQATLEKHGVKKLDPEGQKFDPNYHQAMFEVPNPDVPNNTVVQVVQAGYAIGERVLRPAMVGVAKGGPKQAASKADASIMEHDEANEQTTGQASAPGSSL